MAQDIHEPMIQDREAKLEKILFQADVLRAEIKVLREAQSVAKGVKSERPASKTRQRQLKQEWSYILKFIGDSKEASLEDIEFFSNTLNGYDINEDTLRGQMANYVKQGWLNRISPGVFALTESGAAKCGFVGKEEAPEVGASDGVDAPSDISGGDQSNQWDEDPPEF